MKVVVLTALFVLVCSSLCSAGGLPSTIDVVNSLVERSIDSAFSKIDKGSKLHLTVSDHPDRAWVQSMAVSAASNKGIVVTSDVSANAITIVIDDLSTRYVAVGSADSAMRVITAKMSFLTTHNDVQSVVQPSVVSDTVVCLRRDALAAESKQHHATHGEMPADERTLWDEVLEPAIFVVAAVATVVLLFTVRSQ